jgi:hypothetical protein
MNETLAQELLLIAEKLDTLANRVKEGVQAEHRSIVEKLRNGGLPSRWAELAADCLCKE